MNVMVFPAVLYYRKEGEEKRSKASVTFISDDLSHDHQQVWRMEARAIQILKERTGLDFHQLVRVSEGCGAQFKSQFCVADLCEAGARILGKPGAKASFIYFESNEGKGESDACGSVEKMRIKRMVLRDRKLVIHNAKELVEALSHVPPEVTESYEFTVVEEFPNFERVPAKQRAGVELRGIRKLHQINFSEAGLKTSVVSCLSCARLQEECGLCSNEQPTIPTTKLTRILKRRQAIQNEAEAEQEQDVSGEADDPREQSDPKEEHEEVILLCWNVSHFVARLRLVTLFGD